MSKVKVLEKKISRGKVTNFVKGVAGENSRNWQDEYLDKEKAIKFFMDYFENDIRVVEVLDVNITSGKTYLHNTGTRMVKGFGDIIKFAIKVKIQDF